MSWKQEWKQIRDTGVDEPMSVFYDRVEAFIQDLLDRKAERIGWLKKPIKHSNCVRDYDHCECHDWEKENNILNQALSILKEE